MTQEILSALSSDEVNSIGDTTESLQVATIIKRKTKDIWARIKLPDSEQLIQLDASTDSSLPVLMTVPEEVNKLYWIKYFNSVDVDETLPMPGYQYVTILPITQFIDMITALNPNEDNIGSLTFTDEVSERSASYTFYYRDDVQPRYCTIISNRYVIFDSYDSDLDSTLQSSKTMCAASIDPVFRMEDDFTPNLTEAQLSLLLNEAKALAFFELKQTQHPKAEQEKQRQWASLNNTKAVTNIPTAFDKLPNYGR